MSTGSDQSHRVKIKRLVGTGFSCGFCGLYPPGDEINEVRYWEDKGVVAKIHLFYACDHCLAALESYGNRDEGDSI